MSDSPAAGTDLERRALVAGGCRLAFGGGLLAAACPATEAATAAAPTEPPLRVAVLTHAGAAHLGLYFRALAAAESVSEVVLADPDAASVEEARMLIGEKLVGVHRDHAAACHDGRPRLALVSTEAVRGPAAIAAALDAGCHVLAEKPACVSAADFSPLAERAETAGLHLMLALANRLAPEVIEAKRLVSEGAIGRPYAIEMHLVQDQTRLRGAAYQASWFADPARAGGGHLAWLGIHWLDLAMHLVDAAIVEVAAFTGNVGGAAVAIEDAAAVVLRFAGGPLGTLTSGYYLEAGYQSHLRIWGSGGWLSLDTAAEPVLVVQRHGDVPTVVTPPRGRDVYAALVEAAARAAAGSAPPPLATRDSLRAVRAVFAGYEAASTGRRVVVAD